jgi:hypothetical protein
MVGAVPTGLADAAESNHLAGAFLPDYAVTAVESADFIASEGRRRQ